MNVTKIRLRASEVAKLTGHNRYAKKDETVKTVVMYNKLDPTAYVPKTNISKYFYELPDYLLCDRMPDYCKSEELACSLDEVRKTEKALNEDASECEKLQNKLDYIEAKKKAVNILEAFTIEKLQDKLNPDISEEKSALTEDEFSERIQLNLPNFSQKKLHRSIISDVGMKRGNIKEDSNLDIVEKECNIKIDCRNTQLYKKKLYECETHEVEIVGKIDGMCGEAIVETKNRRNRLFYKIPEYEKVQMEVYMYLLGKEECLWIECFNGQYNQVRYTHDEKFWNGCIGGIKNFIEENLDDYLH